MPDKQKSITSNNLNAFLKILVSGGFRGGALGASAPPAESMVKKS